MEILMRNEFECDNDEFHFCWQNICKLSFTLFTKKKKKNLKFTTYATHIIGY